MATTLICLVCNKLFKVPFYREKTARFCSKLCLYRSYDKGLTKPQRKEYFFNCKVCGIEFKARVPFAKYCSVRCQLRNRYNQYIPHPRNHFVTKCGYCGKLIKKAPCSIKYSKSGKVYCNRSCAAKDTNIKRQIKFYCFTCGKEILKSPSLKRGKHQFCNMVCRGVFQRQLVGNKAPNWKGGYRKTIRERNRARKFWKELRGEILDLFDNKCAQCKRETILHLHHIIPCLLGGEDSNSNLIPLCPPCHSRQTILDQKKENSLFDQMREKDNGCVFN